MQRYISEPVTAGADATVYYIRACHGCGGCNGIYPSLSRLGRMQQYISEPVTAGADATVYIRLLFTHVWHRYRCICSNLDRLGDSHYFFGQCVHVDYNATLKTVDVLTHFCAE